MCNKKKASDNGSLTKRQALSALNRRRKTRPETVDNASPKETGKKCYFFCVACGHLVAAVPESFEKPPPKLCPECREMDDNGWLTKEDKDFSEHLP